jgi:hypothetical protein
MRRAALASLMAVAVASTPVVSSAQETASAGALFDHGVSDMEAGRFESGCPALAESQRLEPRAGTLFTLAECERKWGKVATAAAHYEDYLGLVSQLPADQQRRHQARAREAADTLTLLKPTVPTLALTLPADAPAGVVVTRDQIVLQGASLGLALPVDPGEHVIITRAPGGPDHEVRVTLALAETKQLELEVVQPSPPPVVPAPVAVPAAVPAAPPAAPPPRPLTAPDASPGWSQRTWGYVVGGVGASGVVVGAVTGVLVLDKKSTVREDCTGRACSAAGVAAAHSGQTLATVSTASFAVGLVGLATGAVLVLTAPRAHIAQAGFRAVAPLVATDRHGAWAGVGGRF